MTGEPLIHGREAKDFLGVVEAAMRDLAHEGQDNPQILGIDLVVVFHAIADQPQDFQSTVDHLMLTCPCCCRLHT
jgi:hypothetical protein